jgi:cytochrome b
LVASARCGRRSFGYRYRHLAGNIAPMSSVTSVPNASPSDTATLRKVRVWDLPTRLFHWTLAAAVTALAITGHIGGNALAWHMRLGLLVMTLLAFRLLWGLVGGRWSRFASFVRWPNTVWRYLRGPHRSDDHFEVGHNPLGALSVLALIALLALQVATGLVADDEIASTGPLNRFVANATGLAATSWHKGWGQWGLAGLVSLHLLAIGVYRWRGVNLVKPMINGDKLLPGVVPPSTDSAVTRLLAAVLLALCGAGALWIARQA